MKTSTISSSLRYAATMLLGILAWEGSSLIDRAKESRDILLEDARVTRKYDMDRNGLDLVESRNLIFGEYDKDQNGIIDIQEGHKIHEAMGKLSDAVVLKNEFSPKYQAGQTKVLDALEQINLEQQDKLSN